jgi:hypothetical protein
VNRAAAGATMLALLELAGCASIAPPFPPSLKLPARVTDLSAVQRGAHIYIQFTMPRLNTEALPIVDTPEADLRIGVSAQKFEMRDWLATATQVPDQAGKTLYVTPAAPYIGKNVVIALRLKNNRGRDAGWSNFVALPISDPVARPENVVAKATAKGVEISWTGTAPNFRIYRKVADGEFVPLGEAKQSPYLDTTAEYGRRYAYFVMGLRTATESELSEEVKVSPIDIFAPSVPTGLRAIIGTRSIELTWDRDTEADLAGYRVYRADGDGPFHLIAGNVVSTSYSDRTVQTGVRYRYSVSAFDQIPNESEHSAAIEAALP